MNHKRQSKPDIIEDIDTDDAYGITSYQEIDNMFRKYCREISTNQFSSSRGSEIRSPSPRLNSPRAHNIIQPQSIMKNGSIISTVSCDPTLKDEKNKGNTKQGVNSKGSKMRLVDLHTESTETDEFLYQSYRFEIPQDVLIAMANAKDKEAFIADYVNKNINKDLAEFSKKHSMKMNQAKKFDEDYKKMKEKAERDKIDIFKWLHVKTEFEDLKKKLRAKIMEKINNTNFETLQKDLDSITNSHLYQTNQTNQSSQTKKIVLDNIPVFNNLEILSEVLKEDQKRFAKPTRPSKKVEDPSTSIPMSTRNAQPKESFALGKRSNSTASIFGQKEEKSEGKDADKNKNDQEFYKWDPSKEELFSTKRAGAKNRLSKYIKSSNWNELGFFPLIQSFLNNDKNKPERDAILAKYMNGDLLTPQEYKFIASTSASLNSCVDKKFLQKIVNNLDTEVIDAV